MKYYIIAGEASGDLHGAGLIRSLKQVDQHAEIRCWGGDLMEAAGGRLVKHYKQLAFMGFTEVIMNLKTILKNLKFCKQDILDFHPDVIILIDYPGFNLRIASFAKENHLKVFYYISPQIWAWKESRINLIRKCVDRMFVILPFEKEFYHRFQMDVSFHGHPLTDVIFHLKPDPEFYTKHGLDKHSPLIVLLPGSRKQEIRRMLPVMLEASKSLEGCQVVVAGAPSIDRRFYEETAGSSPFILVSNDTYQLLSHAHAAAVTSGTATLETGLFGVPLVVCYAGGQISYLLAKQLIKVKYISLVNLILNRNAIVELIQKNLNSINLRNELSRLLNDQVYRNSIERELFHLRGMCGVAGVADRVAAEMYNRLSG
jgi:lipid-A-disaccharide synthase